MFDTRLPSTCYYYQRDNGGSLGIVQKSNALWEIEEHWIENVFHFFIVQLSMFVVRIL